MRTKYIPEPRLCRAPESARAPQPTPQPASPISWPEVRQALNILKHRGFDLEGKQAMNMTIGELIELSKHPQQVIEIPRQPAKKNQQKEAAFATTA